MYRVIWESDIEAESPREAAEKAFADIRREGTHACFFECIPADGDGKRIAVDLLEDAS